MTVSEYLDAVKERILTDSLVSIFRLIRERATLTDGHLRARLTLRDNSLLEFSEYVQITSAGQIQVATYSYHWCDADNKLIRRWDNTPHFPALPNSPHHVHVGPGEDVRGGQPMDIFSVLDEIARSVST